MLYVRDSLGYVAYITGGTDLHSFSFEATVVVALQVEHVRAEVRANSDL